MANDSDFNSAVELINNSNCLMIASHTRPDGDACGSMAAMMLALEAMGKKVMPLLLSPMPQWYGFLFDREIPVLGVNVQLDDLRNGSFDQCDAVVIIDTNSYIQLPQFDIWLKETHKPVLVIDHHITSDGLGDVEVIDTSAAAAGQIVFDLFRHAGWKVDQKIAEAIFVALATDTGWFRFSNTDSRVYKDAAQLIEAGAKPAQLYQMLFQNFTVPRFKLLRLVLDRAEFMFDDRAAAGHLFLKDFEAIGVSGSDTENLIDEYRRVMSVEVAMLLVEQKDGNIRCSIRSRGNVDVQAIASKFGGGGHRSAAGLTLAGPMEKARLVIVAEVGAALNR